MTALEFMEKQLQKCKLNYTIQQTRGAEIEALNNIIKKIGYYGEAVEALKKVGDQQ